MYNILYNNDTAPACLQSFIIFTLKGLLPPLNYRRHFSSLVNVPKYLNDN